MITRSIMRFADIALAYAVSLPLIAPSFGGGMSEAPPLPPILGIWPVQPLYLAGVVGLAIGCAWIHRIARGEPEPEANDHHWWSRA